MFRRLPWLRWCCAEQPHGHRGSYPGDQQAAHGTNTTAPGKGEWRVKRELCVFHSNVDHNNW